MLVLNSKICRQQIAFRFSLRENRLKKTGKALEHLPLQGSYQRNCLLKKTLIAAKEGGISSAHDYVRYSYRYISNYLKKTLCRLLLFAIHIWVRHIQD